MSVTAPLTLAHRLQESVRKAGAIASKSLVNITQKKCDPSINADKDKCKYAGSVAQNLFSLVGLVLHSHASLAWARVSFVLCFESWLGCVQGGDWHCCPPSSEQGRHVDG
jgi:hypothetical protein